MAETLVAMPKVVIPRNSKAPPLPEHIPKNPEADIPKNLEAPPNLECSAERVEAPVEAARDEAPATQEVAAPPEQPVEDDVALTCVQECRGDDPLTWETLAPILEHIPENPEGEHVEAPPFLEGISEHVEAPPFPKLGPTWSASPPDSETATPPQSPVEDGLALTLVHEGHVSVIVLRRRPLGFRFRAKKASVVVTYVHEGGYAESLGVKVGMELVAINGESTQGAAARVVVIAKLMVETAKLELDAESVGAKVGVNTVPISGQTSEEETSEEFLANLQVEVAKLERQ